MWNPMETAPTDRKVLLKRTLRSNTKHPIVIGKFQWFVYNYATDRKDKGFWNLYALEDPNYHYITTSDKLVGWKELEEQ